MERTPLIERKRALAESETYRRVALEYYDSQRHPTCSNFRACSERLLQFWLSDRISHDSNILEVGCGMSLVAPWLEDHGFPLRNLTLTDSVEQMLQHSAKWIEAGAAGTIASANSLPAEDSSVDAVVSSLGDPYNCRETWQEFFRVLRIGGTILFSSPSFDWASCFRKVNCIGQSHLGSAEFETVSGDKVRVPSIIIQRSEQEALAREVGLSLRGYLEAPRRMLPILDRSPKLSCLRDDDTAVVVAYLFRKES